MINENKLPETVKEARGKIYLLSRFSGNIGIPAHYGWADFTPPPCTRPRLVNDSG
jgi:hypothetical protein